MLFRVLPRLLWLCSLSLALWSFSPVSTASADAGPSDSVAKDEGAKDEAAKDEAAKDGDSSGDKPAGDSDSQDGKASDGDSKDGASGGGCACSTLSPSASGSFALSFLVVFGFLSWIRIRRSS